MATLKKSSVSNKPITMKTAQTAPSSTTKLLRTTTRKTSTIVAANSKQLMDLNITSVKTKPYNEKSSLTQGTIKSGSVKSSSAVPTILVAKSKVVKEVADSTTMTKNIPNISSLRTTSTSIKRSLVGLVSSEKVTTTTKRESLDSTKKVGLSDSKMKSATAASKLSNNLKISSLKAVELKTKKVGIVSKTTKSSSEKVISTVDKEIKLSSKSLSSIKPLKPASNTKLDTSKPVITKTPVLAQKVETKLKSATTLQKAISKAHSTTNPRNTKMKIITDMVLTNTQTGATNTNKVKVCAEVKTRTANSTSNKLITNNNDFTNDFSDVDISKKNICLNIPVNDLENSAQVLSVNEDGAYELAEQILLDVMKVEEHDQNLLNDSLMLKTVNTSETKSIAISVVEDIEKVIENEIVNDCITVHEEKQADICERNSQATEINDDSNDSIQASDFEEENITKVVENAADSITEEDEVWSKDCEKTCRSDQELVNDKENIVAEIEEKLKCTNNESEQILKNMSDGPEQISDNCCLEETNKIGIIQIKNVYHINTYDFEKIPKENDDESKDLAYGLKNENSHVIEKIDEIEKDTNISSAECNDEQTEQQKKIVENVVGPNEENLKNGYAIPENTTIVCEKRCNDDDLQNVAQPFENVETDHNLEIGNTSIINESSHSENTKNNLNADNEIEIQENYFGENGCNVDEGAMKLTTNFDDPSSSDDFVMVNPEEQGMASSTDNKIQDNVSETSDESLSYAEIVKQSLNINQLNVVDFSDNSDEILNFSEHDNISTRYENENESVQVREEKNPNEILISNLSSDSADVLMEKIALRDENAKYKTVYNKHPENLFSNHLAPVDIICDQELTETEQLEIKPKQKPENEMEYIEKYDTEEVEMYQKNVTLQTAAEIASPFFENSTPSEITGLIHFEDGFKLMRKKRNKRQNKKNKKSHRPFVMEHTNSQEPLNEIQENFDIEVALKRRNSKRKNSFRKYSKEFSPDSNVYMNRVWKSYYTGN